MGTLSQGAGALQPKPKHHSLNLLFDEGHLPHLRAIPKVSTAATLGHAQYTPNEVES